MASISDPMVQQILSGRRIATLATLNDDGSIHLTAVWYLLDGSDICVATFSGSRKARNLTARPRASLLVDVRDPGREKGVAVTADVEITRGEASREINRRIQARYLSPAAMQDPRVGPKLLGMDDITVRLTPTKIFAWDMAAMDAAVFEGAFSTPGYVLPLER